MKNNNLFHQLMNNINTMWSKNLNEWGWYLTKHEICTSISHAISLHATAIYLRLGFKMHCFIQSVSLWTIIVMSMQMILRTVLVLALALLEFTEAQKMDFFTAYDMNKDGKVHPLEVKMSWMAWSNGMLYWSKDANLLAFDRDGDGQLNEPEYRAYEKESAHSTAGDAGRALYLQRGYSPRAPVPRVCAVYV